MLPIVLRAYGAPDVGPASGVPASGQVSEQRERHAHPQGRHEHDGADRHAHEQQAAHGPELGDLEDGDDVGRKDPEEHEQGGGTHARKTLCQGSARGRVGPGSACGAPR